LGGTASERIWIVQAAAVPAIAFGPIFAIISDVYGRRNLILAVWVLFAVGSIVSMTATGMTAVIAGQALSGVASGISGIMFAVASEVLPGAYRAYGQTIVSWVSGLSSLIALLPIGAATTADPVNGWRWVFRIKFILECLVIIGIAALYFVSRPLLTFNTLLTTSCSPLPALPLASNHLVRSSRLSTGSVTFFFWALSFPS